jgi:hypothetical protein
VLRGEQVPTAEKIYSIFETHTDLIKRGKVQTPRLNDGGVGADAERKGQQRDNSKAGFLSSARMPQRMSRRTDLLSTARSELGNFRGH